MPGLTTEVHFTRLGDRILVAAAVADSGDMLRHDSVQQVSIDMDKKK